MNANLPIGIEAYLKEAGFSSTEMLVLRKLVEEESLTIRELASKTGKSTGVLDQSMKKLLSKHIAQRDIVNGQPRYSIHSLEGVVKWVQKDKDEKKEMLDRRHKNFEAFIASLSVDKRRPDIEHFHGKEGIQQAYMKLLDQGQEFLTVMPVYYLAEEDPLRDFRVELFRRRQARKIFQRVIAPDTPLSARFRTKDPFEYRQTMLLPDKELPVSFEKTIVGDFVACINVQDDSAYVLKYPDLARSERDAFQVLWARAEALEKGATHGEQLAPFQTPVPLKTRFYSSLREFLLSKKSIAAFVIFALLAGTLTFGLYKNNRELNLQRMREKVIAIAATGALQLDAKDVQAVWTAEDIPKPEYAKLIATMDLIRRSNAEVQYVYILRPTSDPLTFSFVADADSWNPYSTFDYNGDGVLDAADETIEPGKKYPVRDIEVLREKTFSQPNSNKKPHTDQWGTFITGYAPIRDANDAIVAILAVDIFVEKLDELSAETFSPLIAFITLFLLFVILRYGALNRSLLSESLIVAKRNYKIVMLSVLGCIVTIVFVLYGFQIYKKHLLIQQTGERLMAIAATAAEEFDVQDLNQLRIAKDMETDAYQKVFRQLNEIRNKNPDVLYAYIYRPTNEENVYEFIADADSNYNLPFLWADFNKDGKLDEADENVAPGVQYYDEYGLFRKAMSKPVFGETFDQWGHLITGMAPIKDQQGNVVALLGFDILLSAIR